VLHRDISVGVWSRDVPTPVLSFIDIVPARVHACLERTFELCERIGGDTVVVETLDACLRSPVVNYP